MTETEQRAMKDLSITLGASTESLKLFAESMAKAAQATGTTVADLTRAMTRIAQANPELIEDLEPDEPVSADMLNALLAEKVDKMKRPKVPTTDDRLRPRAEAEAKPKQKTGDQLCTEKGWRKDKPAKNTNRRPRIIILIITLASSVGALLAYTYGPQFGINPNQETMALGVSASFFGSLLLWALKSVLTGGSGENLREGYRPKATTGKRGPPPQGSGARGGTRPQPPRPQPNPPQGGSGVLPPPPEVEQLGDVIIIKVDRFMTQEEMNHVARKFKRQFPDNEIVVLGPGMSFDVVKGIAKLKITELPEPPENRIERSGL